MTMPTPTSNGVAGLGGIGTTPPGLPDVASLAQLAGELFAQWPGAAAPGFPSATADPAQAAPAHPVSAAPALAPAPAPTPTGGAGLGVPEAYAAALPSAAPAATPAPPAGLSPGFVPASPYYFVGEASPYLQGSKPEGAGDDRVTARSFALPGHDPLQALIAEITGAGVRQPTGGEAGPASPAGGASAPSAPGFYFLDASAADVPALAPSAHPPFDVLAIRRDFPILAERVNGRPLIWFDNAATTQKPQAVIDRLAWFYAHENSNIHRAAHELAARSTDAYEAARSKTARFLGAGSADEIVFVRGATEAINLVAKSWGAHNIGAGDEIIVTLLEHHANIVPWQQLAQQTGAKIRVIPVDSDGQILLEEYQRLLNERTKLVAITQVSNALGTITPVKQVVDLAHRAGARVLVDGAQAVSHMRVNVQALDADFYVFSGHKVFAPTGIGVLYGKADLLEAMPPWQGGGNMIADVTFERTVYQKAPARFEAGTGNIADAVGLGAAIDYVERIGLENIARYEHDLVAYATQGLATIPGLHLIGTAPDKASVVSFVLDGYRPEEVGSALNREGIAVRAGHHCAQPILRHFGREATVRPSLAFYNTCEEMDCLVAAVRRLANRRGSFAG